MRSISVVVLVAIALAVSACGGSHKSTDGNTSLSPGPQNSARTVSSSHLIHGGHVLCTASASTPVEAGQPLGVKFAFRNVSKHAVKVGLAPWDVRLVLRAGGGARFDTQSLVSPTIPYIAPTRLSPGETRDVPGLASLLRVRWSGPLRIAPTCETTRLPALRIGVIASGPPPNERQAVNDVVAASGGLFDHCRPRAAGVAVRGQINAPDGNAPPLDAACSVRIRREGRFWRAQAVVLSPPGLHYVPLSDSFARLSSRSGQNAEEIVWEFVLTKNGAISVDSSEADASKAADRMANFWQWTGSSWQKGGDGRCGGFGNSGGGPTGPTIDFVSVCGS